MTGAKYQPLKIRYFSGKSEQKSESHFMSREKKKFFLRRLTGHTSHAAMQPASERVSMFEEDKWIQASLASKNKNESKFGSTLQVEFLSAIPNYIGVKKRLAKE